VSPDGLIVVVADTGNVALLIEKGKVATPSIRVCALNDEVELSLFLAVLGRA